VNWWQFAFVDMTVITLVMLAVICAGLDRIEARLKKLEQR